MQTLTALPTHSTVLRILQVLDEHDALEAQPSSAQDLGLVQHVTRLLDGALPWQRGHGTRTKGLAQVLGTAAGLSGDALHHLALASLLHDMGLLALPGSLTSPSGCLDFRSYEAVQCHPRLAAQWLEPFRFLRRASVIIAHHHERWDGSGYPYGIRGRLIPLEARILSVADAFDAVSVPNVRDRKTRDAIALRILRAASGTQFDPTLVHLLDMLFSNSSTSREDP